MHPREQKGAWSAEDGLPQSGQDLISACFAIAAMDGECGVASQGSLPPNLASERRQPVALALEDSNDGWMPDQPGRTGSVIGDSP